MHTPTEATVARFQGDDNADRRACQSNQRKRLRSDFVELSNQFAPFIRGVTAALRTCHEKTPRLPNHSKKTLNKRVAEPAATNTSPGRDPPKGVLSATAVSPRWLTVLGSDLTRRAHCSGACVKSRRAVRCRGTPKQCSPRSIQGGCSCPCAARLWRRSDSDTS